MKIFYSLKFLKSFNKPPQDIQNIYRAKEKILKENLFHPLLGTHKIKCSNCYSFVVIYKIIAIFKLVNNGI